jgi:hypothetical protein
MPLTSSGFKQTKTKNPILFVNNIADPITPLVSAKHMSTYFEDSVVLTQNSGGHGFSSVLSTCTLEHVAKYLATAELPEEGTVCETDKKPLVDTITKRDIAFSAIVKRWM